VSKDWREEEEEVEEVEEVEEMSRDGGGEEERWWWWEGDHQMQRARDGEKTGCVKDGRS
jgi:hypothetical protein